MVTTTIRKIHTAKNVLQKLSEQPMPVKTAYGISKLIITVNAELAAYEQQRIKLCEKYGKINSDGTQYEIEDRAGFQNEIDELLNIETELNVKPVILTDETRLSAQEIIALDGFIEVKDDD